ncbi:DNA-3-methyladenine glycosylase 2 family protein [Candidatus Kaiserbacteria bacterium]|nr:DNA-3-methyladenine glycosylase 2 family protein [Candidatus Kaiserbacteria bacterium]
MPRNRSLALAHFKRVDPHFYATTRPHHPSLPVQLPAKRTRAQLFASLIRIVTSQQLGTAAARSIFIRVKGVCKGVLSPESILKAQPAALRGAGLSGAKVKTLKEIAKAVKNNSLDLLSLKKIPENEAAEQLMSIWGLGPWSVEMFMMNTLGRSDVFSAGDLGLVRAMEMIYDLPKNTPRTSLLVIAEKWSPYRTYASLLLWRTRDSNK